MGWNTHVKSHLLNILVKCKGRSDGHYLDCVLSRVKLVG